MPSPSPTLIYEHTSAPVKPGDIVRLSDGEMVRISFFNPPHKPASSGKVTVETVDGTQMEYFVGVIGAKWINRTDRPAL